jgi:uncharacterized protein involved in cysteine biosynthesis
MTSSEPSLAFAPGRVASFGDGLAAVPRGIGVLLSTPRTKRWLVPPVALTTLVYVLLFAWAWRWIDRLLDAARAQSIAELDVRVGWLRDALAWLIERDVVVWIAKAGGFLVLLAAAALVALWTFSVVYALVASPFLDVVQGRIEARWFGCDPSIAALAIDLPPSARRARIFAACCVLSIAALVAWWIDSAPRCWLWLAAIPGAFAVAALFARDFRVWFAAEARSQLRGLLPGIKASLLTAFALVLFAWLKLIPVAGWFLFAGVAGFASAIGLLDIPFSRRRWDFRQRMSFVNQHAPAVFAFGLASSVFFAVPIIGPLIGIPASSIGGLWLFCRLDKNMMRPSDRRIARGAADAPNAPSASPVSSAPGVPRAPGQSGDSGTSRAPNAPNARGES